MISFKSHIKQHRQLILYGILGGTGALSDFAIYTLLVSLTPFSPLVANLISTSAGICVSFFLNNRYNFKKHDHLLLRFVTFFAVGGFGILLSAALIYLLFNVVGIGAVIAKIISIPIVVLAQFAINKHVSFADNPKVFWNNLGMYVAYNKSRVVLIWMIIIILCAVVYYTAKSI